MSYYGTGILQPTGTGRPLIEVEPRPVAPIEWCEQAGCPRAKCVGCQENTDSEAS